MLVVSTIGSCRVTNPARQAVSRYPILLNNARVYGYVHSAAEVLQQVRFLFGQWSIPDYLRPLIVPHIPAGVHESARHSLSDIYIVEISSAKTLRIGGTFVQWNHVNRHFAGFLSDAARARKFWKLASDPDAAEKRTFLDHHLACGNLTGADHDLLCELTVEPCEPAMLRRMIEAILRELPRVLFVTHCNALMPDGRPIPGRDRFIRLLSSVLDACKADCFDPTGLMHAFGQKAALSDEGASLTHYSEAFEAALFAEMHSRHLAHLPVLSDAV